MIISIGYGDSNLKLNSNGVYFIVGGSISNSSSGYSFMGGKSGLDLFGKGSSGILG